MDDAVDEQTQPEPEERDGIEAAARRRAQELIHLAEGGW